MKRVVFRIMFALLILTIGISFDVLAAEMQTGILIGYVYDLGMNPIQGARVRVYFHETYEEDYTDLSGFYLVTNIPLCYCLKNATASKEGYITEWVELAIGEATIHDFVLTPVDHVPRSWIVDDDGPADFQTVQEAINNALDWDTVYVRSEVYYENVVVNKTVSLVGENSDTTIVDGGNTGKVVQITVNDAEIGGFTIQKAGFTPWGSDSGIYVVSSSNIITDNVIVDNDDWAIWLDSYSSNNTITDNEISNNWRGCMLKDTSGNTLAKNNITNQGQDGICLWNSSQNVVTENNISSNVDGVALASSHNNSITRNNITNNLHGVSVDLSSNNQLHHNNFINNNQQVYLFTFVGTNLWDDGYPSAGNYWNDYAGTDMYHGFSQNITGSDGIGDSPYVIDDNNTDHYPLMVPWALELQQTDLNDDGVINILDISIVAIAFGSKEGDENYNSIADLDGNEEINILDISIVAFDYGKTVFNLIIMHKAGDDY
jgi:parallel beta-helix repeat protein